MARLAIGCRLDIRTFRDECIGCFSRNRGRDRHTSGRQCRRKVQASLHSASFPHLKRTAAPNAQGLFLAFARALAFGLLALFLYKQPNFDFVKEA
jgi:hypothetical protein